MRYLGDFRPYQHQALEFAKRTPRGYLAAKAGAGKTAIALALASYLMYDEFSARKVLVVAPKRVAAQWPSEAKGWAFAGHLRFTQFIGSPKESEKSLKAVPARLAAALSKAPSDKHNEVRARYRATAKELEGQIVQRWDAFNADADVMCVSFDFFAELVVMYKLDNWPYDLVIFDEASRLRKGGRRGSVTWKAVNSIARKTNSRLLLMSGSPRPGTAHELFAPVALLDGGARLGTTLAAFRSQYLEPRTQNRHTGQIYSWRLRPGMEAALYSRIADLYFAVAPDLGLPFVVIDRPVAVPARVEQLIRQLMRDQVIDLDELEITAPSQGNVVGKVHQMCQGSVFDDNGQVQRLHDAKVDEVKELIEEIDAPAIVCYWYEHDKARLQEAFPDAVDLGTDAGLAAAKAGSVNLGLLHPGSAGHGVDGLQHHFSNVVWFCLPASYELYEQANARVVRSGQKETVSIYRIVASNGVVDQRVVDRLAEKQAEQDQFFEYLEGKQ